MKRNYITIALAILLAACSSTDVEQKKKELEAARAEMKKIKEELDAQRQKVTDIEEELKELDPAFANLLDKSVAVTTVSVSPNEFEHRTQVRGNIASRKNVFISAEVGGTINQVHVREGQRVTAGQILVTLDSDVMRNNIAELKTALELATSVYEKRERLWKQKVGTELDYLQAKNNKESLERKLATAQSQLSKQYIRSPFTGTVDAVNLNAGELATPGQPLINVTSPQGMYISADISERFIGRFEKGDKVSVYFPVQDTILQSTITAVGQVINPDNRTFDLEVALPVSSLTMKPNQVAIVHLTDYISKDAYVVDTKMIQLDESGHYVYEVVKGDGKKKKVAKKLYVKPGYSYEGKTEIIQGLKGGEFLVNKGFRELSEGTEVKIFDEDEKVAKN